MTTRPVAGWEQMDDDDLEGLLREVLWAMAPGVGEHCVTCPKAPGHWHRPGRPCSCRWPERREATRGRVAGALTRR